MNTLFGGRFTSWLSTELRIKRGLTYGASSSNFPTWQHGRHVHGQLLHQERQDRRDARHRLRPAEEGPAAGSRPKEIESSRNYLHGQFPPTLETNASKADAYVRLAFYDLGFDYYDKYLAGIQAVTGELAKAAAAKLLPADDYVLVVVGKSAEIKAQLAKYGTWTERKITDPGF